jgi:hypothetical protein
MFSQVSEFIVVLLFLPVLMNIVLPLGTLAGWLVWSGLRPLFGVRRPMPENSGLPA